MRERERERREMINLKMLFKMIKTFFIVNTIMKLVAAEKPIRTPTLIKKSYSGKPL